MHFDLPPNDVRIMWPACTLDCGIFVEDACVPALLDELQEEEESAHDLSSFFKCVGCRASVAASHHDQEQQVIWTDGASGLNEDNHFL